MSRKRVQCYDIAMPDGTTVKGRFAREPTQEDKDALWEIVQALRRLEKEKADGLSRAPGNGG